MPALQQLALQPQNAPPPSQLAEDWQGVGGTAALVSLIPQSQQWATLRVEIPFESCNATLAQQLDMAEAIEDLKPWLRYQSAAQEARLLTTGEDDDSDDGWPGDDVSDVSEEAQEEGEGGMYSSSV